MTKEEKNLEFDPEGILVAEYEYIAQTAFQANEDRARVTTFYLVSVGSLFGAFFGTKNTPSPETYRAFSGLFIFLSSFGLLTLLQLVRLRQAWFESICAMNKIKDFIILRSQNPQLDEAFRWRTSSLPSHYKPWSVAFMLALQVIFLGGITLGASIYYASLAIEKLELYYAFAGGSLFILIQFFIYRRELKKKSNPCPQTPSPVE